MANVGDSEVVINRGGTPMVLTTIHNMKKNDEEVLKKSDPLSTHIISTNASASAFVTFNDAFLGRIQYAGSARRAAPCAYRIFPQAMLSVPRAGSF